MSAQSTIAALVALAFVGCTGSNPGPASAPPHHEATSAHAHSAPVASSEGASNRPTQAYRQEHAVVVKRLDAAIEHARSLDAQQPEEVKEHVAHVMGFFKDELLPHAAAEEAILYAKADEVAGSKAPYRFTESLRYEHTVVHCEVGALEHWVHKDDRSEAALEDFGQRVTKLGGLIHAHFGAEEDVVLAALDRVMTREQFHHEIVEPVEAHVRKHSGGGHHGH